MNHKPVKGSLTQSYSVLSDPTVIQEVTNNLTHDNSFILYNNVKFDNLTYDLNCGLIRPILHFGAFLAYAAWK